MTTKQETKAAEQGGDRVVALREVKSILDSGRDEIAQLLKEQSEATEEAKSAINDKLQAAMGRLEESEVKFAELRKQLDDTELSRKRGFLFGNGAPRSRSIGDVLTSSDEYKSFSKTKGATKSAPVYIEGGFFGTKADAIITEGSATSGAALTEPFLVQQPFRQPVRQLTMRDLVPRNSLTTDALEYICQTHFNYLYGEVRAATGTGAVTVSLKTGVATAAHIPDGSEFAGVSGFYNGQSVTFDAGNANEETVVISNVDRAAGTFDCTLATDHAAGVSVTADDFAYTPETLLKPRARATFERKSEQVKTLATSIPVSRQVMRDATLLSQMVNQQLIEALRLTEETQMLYGDGSADQLLGFFNNTDVPEYLWSSGVVGDTRIDAIRKAITLGQLAHFGMEAILIHPTDWQNIELLKDGAGGAPNTGGYILPNVPVSTAQPQLFRIPVIPSTALAPGDCLIGAFSVGCALWDREEANIRIADQHEDFFARNMELVLAEERMLFTVYYPESFVRISFDSAPT